MSSYEIGSGGEVPSLNTPEPAPNPSDGAAVVDLVIADLRERDFTGTAKYGTRLKVGNGRRPLIDAYQEVLDLAQYMRQEIAERCELDLQIAELTRQREAEERLHRLQTGDLNFQLAEARAALERQNAAMREALALIYGKWENGETCYEFPDTSRERRIGNAFDLTPEERAAIRELLK